MYPCNDAEFRPAASAAKRQTRIRFATRSDHRAVVRALNKRDADAAADALGIHVTQRVDQIQDVIKEGFAQISTGQSMGER